MHIIAENIGIHTLAVPIDAQTRTATDFLPLANFTATLFQRANRNTFGLSQPSRSAECEKMKRTGDFFRITIQKQLLVLHDQVIGVNIVGGLFLFIISCHRST